MKIDARYQYLNHHISKVENVNIVLNEKIDLYADGLDAEFEAMSSIEDIRSMMLDFMMDTREQMNILLSTVTELREFNRTLVLGSSVDNNSIAFKKEMLKHRY